MKRFMDKDFLLTTDTAKMLYHTYAAPMPIADYHCHVDPKEIFEDRKFDTITQVWLGGDHYKWRILRSNGVDERYITGDASDWEKFEAFATALPKAIGNPMYHWCHLELKTYFGYEGDLNADTAKEVWQMCNSKLQNDPGMTVRGLIRQSNVAMIGTTDDPCDTLEWHERLAADSTMQTAVLPSFRPDKALNIDKPGWQDYIARLAQVSGVPISGIDALEQALSRRMDRFDAVGCRASDHGLDYVMCRLATKAQADAVLAKGLAGQAVTVQEAEVFKTWLLLFCGRQYAARGWVQQWHYNCLRNPNSVMLERLGPDTGFDMMNSIACAGPMAHLMDELNKTGELPKTIVYSLNAADNEMLDTLIGAFQGSEIAGKIQHGSGWWFNDTKSGMRAQMTSLANLGLLGNFVGMLTDSRSFLSYTRHAYFRRILCEMIGGWVENGEYPCNETQLGALVQGICFENAKRYFGL